MSNYRKRKAGIVGEFFGVAERKFIVFGKSFEEILHQLGVHIFGIRL